MKLIIYVSFILLFLCCIVYFKNDNIRISRVCLPERLLSLRSLRWNLVSDARFGQPGRTSFRLDPSDFKTEYELLDKIVGPEFKVSRRIPVEYRMYPTGSSGMDWHSDQRVLTNVSYYEAILTLANDSDSFFQYRKHGRVSVSCPPGRLVLVRPNGPSHRVTPVTRGSREILKFVVVPSCV